MQKKNNTLNPTHLIFTISLFFMIIFSSTAVVAETSYSTTAISEDKKTIEQPAGISKTSLSTMPKLGPELQEIAGALIQYLVIDADTTNSVAVQDNTENDLGFALTSSFINNQLMDGMRLEFHANPLNGGGSIRFKKVF